MKRYILPIAVAMIFPIVVFGAEGTTVNTFIDNIPFLSGEKTTQAFVDAMYKLAIALASIIVVIRLMMAGAKYMLSEVVSSKSKAKEDIKNALLGLLIILAAVLILGTINPKLVGLNFLSDASKLDIKNQDTDVIDKINFKPGGDPITGAKIAAICNNGLVSTQEQCVKDNLEQMLRSCKNNGGSRLNKYVTPGVSYESGAVGYSYYSYACE